MLNMICGKISPKILVKLSEEVKKIFISGGIITVRVKQYVYINSLYSFCTQSYTVNDM